VDTVARAKFLRDYAGTDKQRELLDAIAEHGSQRAAARAHGIDPSDVRRAVNAVQVAATRAGADPEHFVGAELPTGLKVRGTSTLHDEAGNVKLQWTKTTADGEAQRQAQEAALQAMCEAIPRAEPVAAPAHTNSDLAACYVISDYHLAQLSYAPETGDDWDTDIAERLLLQWFGAAIQSAPNAHTGILTDLGDLLHHDGLDSVTSFSQHPLDADTRFQRLVRVAVRCLRQIVQMMLEKHKDVHVILAEGNHDAASSVWLREMFAALFESEPRVTVDTSPAPFNVFEWGKTMLGFHHGHKVKLGEVSKAIAGKFPETFGRTRYRYVHTGHLHHVAAKEDALMVAEQHPTLAAKDSYAARMGCESQRGATVITYSRQHGEVARNTIRPEAVSA